MDSKWFKGKKITVMGIGLHGGGVAVVRFLSECGARVIATDLKTKEHLTSSLDKLKDLKNVEYVLGQHRQEDFTCVDMVIKNPAIPWTDEHVQSALKNNVSVEMDSSIFFKLCKNPIIGVTGTKGKTTTTMMIAAILKKAGKSVVNVGVGQVSVLDKLAELKKDSVVVFELSSWRLSALGRSGISPHVAVVTNIMRDHLNYYKTMDKYVRDKKYIFSNQSAHDWLVFCPEDEVVSLVVEDAKAQKILFCQNKSKGKCQIYLEDDVIYLDDGIDARKVVCRDDLKLPGMHNVKNAMAAIGAAHAMSVELSDTQEALHEFAGVEHRLELVGELEGVKYYNDTAATIPDAAMSSIDSFEQSLILIAGGNDKELDFSEFAKKIIEKTKKTFLIKGSATDKIVSEIEKINHNWLVENVEIVSSMQEVVEKAKLFAQHGDVVLLSPGAASFGMFNNEFDRGEQFRREVVNLKT